MFVIRNTFTAKPGSASKLAKLMKEVMSDLYKGKVRIMTDYIGPMNTVIMEMEVSDLAEFERSYKEYGERPDVREKMKDYADLYLQGYRQVYRVV